MMNQKNLLAASSAQSCAQVAKKEDLNWLWCGTLSKTSGFSKHLTRRVESDQ
jgi:hypothetical protein